jgi:hypothetical protein
MDVGGDIAKSLQSKEILEILFALLLLFATIGSAYCVYEAHKWGGVQGVAFGNSSRLRAESIRQDALANEQTMIDVQAFLEWVDAKNSNQTAKADFLETRFRAEFVPAFEAWLDQPGLGRGGHPPGHTVRAQPVPAGVTNSGEPACR